MGFNKFNAHFPQVSKVINNIFENLDNKDFFSSNFNFSHSTPLVNVSQTEEAYTMEVYAAGFKKEDFNIDVTTENITISAEVKEDENAKNTDYTFQEFKKMPFKRHFKLSKNVDIENVSASYIDGVLHITLPKKEAVKTSKNVIIS
jgi:HSP20 family protein